jgi:hypothetical protein
MRTGPHKPAPVPLHERHASVGSGGIFECVVTIPGDHGERPILFQGPRELAERIAHCWNAQLGVQTESIRPVINPDA